jgi:replication factor C subunit 3/5
MLSIYKKYKVTDYDNFDDIIKEKYKNVIGFFQNINYYNLPNILIYGEEGSCKKTLIYMFFKNIPKYKLKLEYKINNKIINYMIYHSKHYIEIDLSQLENYKKYILINFIKEINSTKKISDNNNKIIIIHNIHLLNIDDQFILRKIIEQNIKICRFILISNTINNLIEPIKSRCFLIKTPGFTKSFIKKKINLIIKKEKIKITKKNLNKLLDVANKNLKKSFLELDFYLNLQKYGREKEYFKIKDNNLEMNIRKLYVLIRKKKLDYTMIDNIIYILLIDYNISYNKTIKVLFKILENNVKNDQDLYEIIDLNYEYNKKIINSNNKNKTTIYFQSYLYKLNMILIK